MPYFHKLGEPFRQSGIPGIVFPVQFSETDEPFHAILSTSVIVSGVVKDGELIVDEDELNTNIAALEADLALQQAPVAPKISIADRIGAVASLTLKTKAVKLAKKSGA